MKDQNNNGIPDSHDLWFPVVRGLILVWSIGLLTVSYFKDTNIDQSFIVTVFGASAASFGLDQMKRKTQQPIIDPDSKVPPSGRTEVPVEFINK